MKIEFITVTSTNKVTNNKTFGTNLIDVMVKAELRPFPYKGVNNVKIYNVSNNEEIPLNSLNRWEQNQIMEEIEAYIKRESLNEV